MESYLAPSLGALVLLVAGVMINLLRGIKADTACHDVKLERIETILTGASGDNGLSGDVKMLRERSHTLGDKMQNVFFRLDILEDRRHGEPDRRAST